MEFRRDWELVDQVVVEVHDHKGQRLGNVVSMLKSLGFAVRSEAQRSSVSAQGFLAVIPSALRLFYVYAKREERHPFVAAQRSVAPEQSEDTYPNAKRFKPSF